MIPIKIENLATVKRKFHLFTLKNMPIKTTVKTYLKNI